MWQIEYPRNPWQYIVAEVVHSISGTCGRLRTHLPVALLLVQGPGQQQVERQPACLLELLEERTYPVSHRLDFSAAHVPVS
jgi:hypothetical protein